MSEQRATRTLVKSPPELWAECSDARSLARHLGDAIGEIRIKRLEPETAVAWEGERISGTVRLEPSGWGTKVTLTAEAAPPEAAERPHVTESPKVAEPPEPEAAERPQVAEPPEPEAAERPQPETIADPAPEPALTSHPPVTEATRSGFFARLRRRFMPEPVVAMHAPEPVVPPTPKPAPPAPEPPAAAMPTGPRAQPQPAPSEPAPPEPAAIPIDLTAALDSLGKAHHRPFSRA
jgi:hypothetical protein